jgi:hypothetical protein
MHATTGPPTCAVQQTPVWPAPSILHLDVVRERRHTRRRANDAPRWDRIARVMHRTSMLVSETKRGLASARDSRSSSGPRRHLAIAITPSHHECADVCSSELNPGLADEDYRDALRLTACAGCVTANGEGPAPQTREAARSSVTHPSHPWRDRSRGGRCSAFRAPSCRGDLALSLKHDTDAHRPPALETHLHTQRGEPRGRAEPGYTARPTAGKLRPAPGRAAPPPRIPRRCHLDTVPLPKVPH